MKSEVETMIQGLFAQMCGMVQGESAKMLSGIAQTNNLVQNVMKTAEEALTMSKKNTETIENHETRLAGLERGRQGKGNSGATSSAGSCSGQSDGAHTSQGRWFAAPAARSSCVLSGFNRDTPASTMKEAAYELVNYTKMTCLAVSVQHATGSRCFVEFHDAGAAQKWLRMTRGKHAWNGMDLWTGVELSPTETRARWLLKTAADIASELAPTTPDEDEKVRWRKAQKNTEAGTVRWLGTQVATVSDNEVHWSVDGCKEAQICINEAKLRTSARTNQ